jgi:5-methylcytosine-specific restriction protein A
MKFRDNPVCEICDAKGITKQTEEIHHKIPFERGTTLAEIERLAFDYDNLISVCIDCHKELHRHLVKSKFM